MVQLTDFAARFQIMKPVERKRQIRVSLNSGMIKRITTVRFDQMPNVHSVWDFAKRWIAHLDRMIKIFLFRRFQSGGGDQRDARLIQRALEFRARHWINDVARELVAFHKEPDVQAQIVISCHIVGDARR